MKGCGQSCHGEMLIITNMKPALERTSVNCWRRRLCRVRAGGSVPVHGFGSDSGSGPVVLKGTFYQLCPFALCASKRENGFGGGSS